MTKTAIGLFLSDCLKSYNPTAHKYQSQQVQLASSRDYPQLIQSPSPNKKLFVKYYTIVIVSIYFICPKLSIIVGINYISVKHFIANAPRIEILNNLSL